MKVDKEFLKFIYNCIDNDDMHAFYTSKRWKEKRKQIIARDHCECQSCKRQGRLKILKVKSVNKHERAYVHHKKHLKNYPELALEDSNLETLCFACHELEHTNERHHFKNQKERYTNEERW